MTDETTTQAVERLAALSPLDFDACSKAEAKKLNVQLSTLRDEVKAARKARNQETTAAEVDIEALENSAWELISSDDVLSEFSADWHRLIAGEIKNAKILFLVATSRLFPKAMHAAIKGPSSAGKSEIRQAVLSFFPPESIISFTALSEKALLYTEAGFEHKILSMGEATGSDEQNFQDYLLRELMSEGKLRYPTVQKVGNDLITITIEKDGPVCFLVTTTRHTLNAENETRMLSLDVDDSEQQTRAVLRKVAQIEGLNAPSTRIDFTRWHDFQRWLAAGNRSVVVPFAVALSEAVPPRAVRLRRDVGQIIRAIKSHALLHRQHRELDEYGQIIANIDDDYLAVRNLMHDLLRETSEAKPKATILETIAAVETATEGMGIGEGATALAVARLLKLDKSAAHRRLSAAVHAGFVSNLEIIRGKPGRYVATGQTIDDLEMLPSVEVLKELIFEESGQSPRNRLQPCNREGQDIETQYEIGCNDTVQPDVQPINPDGGCNNGCGTVCNRKGDVEQTHNHAGCTVASCSEGYDGIIENTAPDDLGEDDGDAAEREAIQAVDVMPELPSFLDRRTGTGGGKRNLGKLISPKPQAEPDHESDNAD